ncbi:MAG: type IA DNA topoisomerase, partial [Lachnospiraceae bacterium]|nr:type IA DNA topoisomerase [Lachnospiraceae bacterium]
SAVAKEIDKNIRGLMQYEPVSGFAALLIEKNAYRGVGKSRYVNDKQITDHYAIIPTGQGLRALEGLSSTAVHIYELVARRFLSIFYPAAVYEKVALVSRVETEQFVSNFKVLKKEGYLAVARPSFFKKEKETENTEDDMKCDEAFLTLLENVKKGSILKVKEYQVKEGETSPPKRYNSGSMILTMENAGQFIEDEELRAQIKGSGIGTSATRAEILKKLVHIKYLKLNKKTQVITPTLLGEMIYDVVDSSMKALLDPALTASWEKGLSGVADGSITETEYLDKLNGFVTRRTEYVKQISNQSWLHQKFDAAAGFYQK